MANPRHISTSGNVQSTTYVVQRNTEVGIMVPLWDKRHLPVWDKLPKVPITGCHAQRDKSDGIRPYLCDNLTTDTVSIGSSPGVA